MGENFELAASISLKGEQEFRAGITNANTALREIASETTLVDEKFKGQQNTMAALSAKHDALARSVEAHKAKEAALESAMANAKSSQEKVGQSLEKLRGQRDKETAKLEDLKKIYGESSDEVKEQEEKVKKLSETIKKGEKNYQTAENRVKNWQTQLNGAKAETLRANRALEENEGHLKEAEQATDKCASSIDKFGREVKESSKEMEKSGKKTVEWGDKFATALAGKALEIGIKLLTAACKKVAEFAKYSVEAGKAFEAAMSEVGSLSGATGKDFSALTDKAKELGSATKFSATEVANAFKYMSLAGWSTQQMLSGVDGVLNLAASSGMELAAASDMLTDYLSAFSMSAEEGAYMADMLAYAQANSNTTAQQLGDAYGNCAANLNTAGQDIETVTALLEGMANQGLKGSQAGTALGSIMTQITQKMEDGKIAIGDTLVTVADAEGNFLDLTVILDSVGQALEGMGTMERSAALGATFNKTALSGLNLVLNEGVDKIAGYEEELRRADGTAAAMADTMQDNLEGDLTTYQSALEGLGIAVYDHVKGPLRGIVQGVTKVISGITKSITHEKSQLEEFIDGIKTSNEEVENLLGRAKESMDTAASDAANLEAYKAKIEELNFAFEKTEFEKYQMQQIVGELSGSIPELAAAFNEETCNINLTKDAIEMLFAREQDYLLQQAAMKAKADAMEALMQAELNVAKAEGALQEATDASTDAMEKNQKSADYLAGGCGDYCAEVIECGEAVRESNDALTKAKELQEEAQKEFDLTAGAVDTATDRVAEHTAELEKAGVSTKEATEATEDFGDAAAGECDAAAEAAEEAAKAFQEMKDDISDSIEGSISMLDEFSGGTEVTADQIKKNLDSQIKGIGKWSENMAKLGKAAGNGMSQELYDKLAEMGPKGANLVDTLVKTLESDTGEFELICGKWSEALELENNSDIIASYTSAGDGVEAAAEKNTEATKEVVEKGKEEVVEAAKGTGEAAAKGVEEGTAAVAEAAGGVVEEGANAVGQANDAFRENAKASAQGVAEGIKEGSPFAVNAAYAMAGEVMKAAQSNSSGFHTVGYNMMTGVVSGLNSGSSLVYDKVRSILDTAKKEARKETKSSSPSRVWRDEVGTPIAQGLEKGISDGTGKVQAASRDAAKATLTAAKEELGIHSPSTAFEKQVGKQIVEGTAFGIKVNKKKSKKEAKKMAQEVAQAAAEAVENFKAKNVNKVSQTLDDEEYMWKQLIKKAKKGSKAYQKEIKKIAKENLKEISQQRKAEKFSTQDSLIETYKQYYELSAKAEMDYWELARKQFAEGTEARISADQKYFEAKENYNEQLKTLQDDYYEKCAEINEKLLEDVDEVTEAYESAFSERKEAIRSAFGSFDAFTSESEAPETLLKNMQSQVTGYALWAEQLAELEGKKILKEPFLEELRQMGPAAAATIVALNQMTAEQLALAQEAWDEKDRLAEAQAAKETEVLRIQSESRIKELREQAQKELNAQKQAYEAAAAEVSQAIAEPLAKLVKNSSKLGSDAVAGMIAGLKGKVADKKTAEDLKTVEKKLAAGMNGLPAKGKTIGKDTLAGLLKGLTNKLEIKKGAKSFVKELEDAIRKEAGIHSPSTRFRDAVGVQIPAGVAEGMEKGTEKAVQSGAGMVAAMLEGSKEKIRQQQAAIAEQMAGIHAAEGVAAINGITAHTVQKTSVIVNNSGVAEMLGSITAEMREMRDDMRRFRVVLDTGETVGVFTAAIGNELARQAARW